MTKLCISTAPSEPSRRGRLLLEARRQVALPGIFSSRSAESILARLAECQPIAAAVLWCLTEFVRQGEEVAGPSQELVAQRLGRCVRSVKRGVKALAQIGALEVLYDESVVAHTIAVYRLHPGVIAAARERRASDQQASRSRAGWRSRRRAAENKMSPKHRRTSGTPFDSSNKHTSVSSSRDARPPGGVGNEKAMKAVLPSNVRDAAYDLDGLLARVRQVTTRYCTDAPAPDRNAFVRLVNRHGMATVASRLREAVQRPAWLRREVKNPVAYLVACAARELPAPPSRERIFASPQERQMRRDYARAIEREVEWQKQKTQYSVASLDVRRAFTVQAPAVRDPLTQDMTRVERARAIFVGNPRLLELYVERRAIPTDDPDRAFLAASMYVFERAHQSEISALHLDAESTLRIARQYGIRRSEPDYTYQVAAASFFEVRRASVDHDTE